MKQGAVAVKEVQEENEANSDITKKAFLYQFKLTEWQNHCTMLQQKITQAKYENQIELAKMKLEIEAEYEEQLEKFQQKASQEAQRSKLSPAQSTWGLPFCFCPESESLSVR